MLLVRLDAGKRVLVAVARLDGERGELAGEACGVFARAGRDLEQRALVRQNLPQDIDDRIGVARGGRGMARGRVRVAFVAGGVTGAHGFSP